MPLGQIHTNIHTDIDTHTDTDTDTQTDTQTHRQTDTHTQHTHTLTSWTKGISQLEPKPMSLLYGELSNIIQTN